MSSAGAAAYVRTYNIARITSVRVTMPHKRLASSTTGR